jgi:hypothetical protein
MILRPSSYPAKVSCDSFVDCKCMLPPSRPQRRYAARRYRSANTEVKSCLCRGNGLLCLFIARGVSLIEIGLFVVSTCVLLLCSFVSCSQSRRSTMEVSRARLLLIPLLHLISSQFILILHTHTNATHKAKYPIPILTFTSRSLE